MLFVIRQYLNPLYVNRSDEEEIEQELYPLDQRDDDGLNLPNVRRILFLNEGERVELPLEEEDTDDDVLLGDSAAIVSLVLDEILSREAGGDCGGEAIAVVSLY